MAGFDRVAEADAVARAEAVVADFLCSLQDYKHTSIALAHALRSLLEECPRTGHENPEETYHISKVLTDLSMGAETDLEMIKTILERRQSTGVGINEEDRSLILEIGCYVLRMIPPDSINQEAHRLAEYFDQSSTSG